MTKLSLKPQDQTAVLTFIKAIQTNYPEQVQQVILFGSKVRGDDTVDSDIDLLVLLNHDNWQLGNAIRILGARVSLNHDVLLSIRAMSPKRWAKLATYQLPLYQSIKTDGVSLYPIVDTVQGTPELIR